jgi:hypothetical protein
MSRSLDEAQSRLKLCIKLIWRGNARLIAEQVFERLHFFLMPATGKAGGQMVAHFIW